MPPRVAGEVINPRRTFPRAILRGVATVGFLYLSMALTVVLVLPGDTTGSQQITAFSTLLQIASGHTLSQAGDMVAVGTAGAVHERLGAGSLACGLLPGAHRAAAGQAGPGVGTR